jgi:2-polyprenyl-3-methyl-5-hydroxy-6-metoxy-1,4-benzoquinol methylase
MMPERPSPADPEVDSCILCGSVANEALVVRGFKIAQCSSCGHQFLPSPISQNHVAQTFSDAYFFGGGAGYTNYLEQQPLLEKRGAQYAKIVEKHLGRKGKVFDVGAAAGFLMQGWLNQDWAATGIEPNLSMVQHGQERGLDLHHGVFEDSPAWAKESYDCISMVQVISHLPSPIEALRLAYKMLNPNGILLVETWDRTSWIASAMRGGWHEYSPPSVLHWFHRKSLTHAANLVGFEFVESQRALRWLNIGHAKSLLKHMSATSKLARLASIVATVFPSQMNVLYPGDDLFWALYRKPNSQP